MVRDFFVTRLYEAELGDERLAAAQDVGGPHAALAQQVAQLVLRQPLDVVLDAVEVDAALLQERGELPTRRARALLVDGDPILSHRPRS